MSDNAFKVEATVSMLRKNRGGDVLRIALATVDETKLLDVRQMFVPRGANEYQATKKGFAIAVRKLDELTAALVAARRKAVEFGWITDAEASDGGRCSK